MTDDPSTSSAAPNEDSNSTTRDDDTARNGAADGTAEGRRRERMAGSRRRRKKRQGKKNNPGLNKKLEFVTHLLRSLDLVVFAELSSLYYMECSLIRFLLRSFAHFLFLTPKDHSFPFALPARRMHVILVLVPNFICMLLHLFGSVPVGPDFHRGYQHGGIIIDFVGQKPATSRIYYLWVDVAILVMQCIMLNVHSERERLRVLLKTFRPLLPEVPRQTTTGRTIDDLDAEERGVSMDTREAGGEGPDGMELQPLRRQSSNAAAEDGPDVDAGTSLRRESSDEGERTHFSDIMDSGNAILGEYHIIHGLRSAATDLEATTAHSLQSISYGATLAMIRSRQGARARMR